MTDIDYAERVQRGIALLDQKWPAWATEINLDRLDIRSGTRCMTAQYAGRDGGDPRWEDGAGELDLDNGDGDYEAHGFNVSVDDVQPHERDAHYGALNGLWKAAIEARRAQAQDAPAEPEATA